MPKCLECSTDFKKGPRRGDFCGSACKSRFHNRRTRRGAALYDAMMLRAVQPGKVKDLDARIELLIAQWREEDVKAGRTRTTKSAYDVGYDLPLVDAIASYA